MQKNKLYAVIDLETTGLSCDKHDIIQVSGLKFDHNFNVVGTFNQYIKVNYVSHFILNLIHIDLDFLDQNGRYKSEVLNDFAFFLQDVTYLIGHNIKNFDLKFLKSNDFKTEQFHVIDTLHYSRKVNTTLNSHKLDYLVQFYNIENKFNQTHSAINDCFYELEILYNLHQQLPVSQFLSDVQTNTRKKIHQNTSKNVNMVEINLKKLQKFTNKSVCFSGRFTLFDKKEVLTYFSENNIEVHSNIKTTTDVLIYVNESTKYKKACDLGILKIDQATFIKLFKN